jgi:seryl-tRNA synthetase
MLDITLLRKDLPASWPACSAARTPQPYLDVAAFSALEAERKTIQTRTEELQASATA